MPWDVTRRSTRYYKDPNDTGLRFTDVLFGFALREVVLRAAEHRHLGAEGIMHLVLATVTILGSYIGFRNSLKRGQFKLKFFNLVLVRFGLDQVMVLTYFLLAIRFDVPKGPNSVPSAHDLLWFDLRVVLSIFLLYLLWDLASTAMQRSGKYSLLTEDEAVSGATAKPFVVPGYRTKITLVFLVLAGLATVAFAAWEPNGDVAIVGIGGLAALMIGYRFVKDSYEPAPKASTTDTGST